MAGQKISHDYMGSEVNTFSYRDLWERGITEVGIPCKQNRLIVIDVDVAGASHQNDGREYWANFCREFGVPPTYTIKTKSGGFHFYFKLPEAINHDTFAPPGQLAPGVDVKWNGWVAAPPTPGYVILNGSLAEIADCPPSLMAEMARIRNGSLSKTFDVTDPNAVTTLHSPFTQIQLIDLSEKISWVQQNASLSRSDWRDGLFALKAGIDDEAVLDEFVCRWTQNKNYHPGDEEEARKIVARADKFGPIGPGSIFSIINQVRKLQGVPDIETPFTIQEILDRSRVHKSIKKDGSLVIEASESNAAALLGAIIDEETLYHDVRSDLYIYKGRPHSDAELTSIFLPMLQSTAFGLGLEKFRRATVSAGIDVLMATRRKDPHRVYLQSLKWDGIPRVEKFFIDYVGLEDTPYIRVAGKNLWSSLAARGLHPGCKLDSMFIIEGSEGIRKSSLIEAIAGQYTYAPSQRDIATDIDVLRQMHQSVITELPELVGIVGQNSEFVKAFLAKPFDNIRSLFARKATRNDRGFIIIGTTNSDKYLSMDMGSRRFWPIVIPSGCSIDTKGIINSRDQLFAEGIALYKDGHEYWNMPKELLNPIVANKVVEDPITNAIREMVGEFTGIFTILDVYRKLEAGGFINRGLTTQVSNRIEGALKRIGCERDGHGWKTKAIVVNQMINTMVQVANQQSLMSQYL